jgi:hypothetical protein
MDPLFPNVPSIPPLHSPILRFPEQRKKKLQRNNNVLEFRMMYSGRIPLYLRLPVRAGAGAFDFPWLAPGSCSRAAETTEFFLRMPRQTKGVDVPIPPHFSPIVKS